MRRFDFFQLGAYAAAAVFAVGGAFIISLRFMGPARAQEGAPNSASTPQAASQSESQPAQGAQATNAQTNQAESSAQGGLAEIEAFLEPFIYDVVNRRDPFLPYAEYSGQGVDDSNLNNLSPSQRWDLEQLKLVGILWDVRAPKAMFMDPEKEVMVLGRDESIGKRSGYIAAIREGEVVIVEAIRKRGDIIYKTKVLRIER